MDVGGTCYTHLPTRRVKTLITMHRTWRSKLNKKNQCQIGSKALNSVVKAVLLIQINNKFHRGKSMLHLQRHVLGNETHALGGWTTCGKWKIVNQYNTLSSEWHMTHEIWPSTLLSQSQRVKPRPSFILECMTSLHRNHPMLTLRRIMPYWC